MNYWGHAITSNVAVGLLAILFFYTGKNLMSGLTMLVVMQGFSYADSDLRMDAHRSWYFHSAIPAVFILGVSVLMPESSSRDVAGAAMFCISHGTHLLFDVKIYKKGKRGTYLIYLFKGNRANVEQTDAWLLLNAAVCISLAVITAAWGNV